MENHTSRFDDEGFNEFEVKFIKLLNLCEQLKAENEALRAKQSTLVEKNEYLVDKNELARVKVASILNRLKQPELEV